MPAVPTPLTPLVDRAAELARLEDWLARPDIRLVTLTGPAGAGKTRLAIEVGLRLGARFTAGARFVDVAALDEPEAALDMIHRALDTPELEPGADDVGELLLLLDNFEHVLSAAPRVVDSLRTRPGVKVLVTSRAALRVRGERELPVQPLPLLQPEQALDLEAAVANAAIALFVACAQAVQPDFALTSENVIPIAEICLKLDGLPLAIELAAAHINLLPPSAILARLDRRLDLLIRGARDLPPRQQTLRGALAWGLGLLSDEQQRLFRQLSVFDGGCTIDAIRYVCELESDESVLDRLAVLVDHSLVRIDPLVGDGARCGMLETIREFAVECASARPVELEQLQRRHAEYFASLATTWPERTAQEVRNLRAAHAWATAAGDIDLVLRLSSALAPTWQLTAEVAAARSSLEAALAVADTSSAAAAWATFWSGALAERDGDLRTAEARFTRAALLARERNDTRLCAAALDALGMLACQRHDFGAGRDLFAEAFELADHTTVGGRAPVSVHLALAELELDRVADARSAFQFGFGQWRSLAPTLPASPPPCLAIVAAELGERAVARELLDAVLTEPPRDVETLVLVLLALAVLAAVSGEGARALRLAGAADAFGASKSQSGWRWPVVARRLESARAELRPAVASAAWTAGHGLSIDEALAFAREAPLPTANPALARLTTREREIVGLLARGYRNREIGAHLVISERTAEWHVANVLAKLGLESRAQLGPWLAEQGTPVV